MEVVPLLVISKHPCGTRRQSRISTHTSLWWRILLAWDLTLKFGPKTKSPKGFSSKEIIINSMNVGCHIFWEKSCFLWEDEAWEMMCNLNKE